MSLYKQDAGLKGNRLMVQRKRKLACERQQKVRGEGPGRSRHYGCCERGARPLQPWRIFLLPESTEEREPELILPSQTHQGTKFSGGQASTRAGQYPSQKLPVGVGPEGQPAGYYWTHAPFSTSGLLNWKNSERTRVYPFRTGEGVHPGF